jgi:hypothetical protein
VTTVGLIVNREDWIVGVALFTVILVVVVWALVATVSLIQKKYTALALVTPVITVIATAAVGAVFVARRNGKNGGGS